MTEPPSRVFTPAWLSPADVKQWLKLNEADVDDDALVVRCCAQTELYVQRCRPEMFNLETDPPLYDPDAEVYQGAVMYAAREVRRRNSPAGVQSFGDAGVTFVSKFDSDIERALHQGSWAIPRGRLMPDIAAAAADLVEKLRAGGLRACMDLADLNPPGLIVRAPEVSYRFKAGDWDAAWTMHAVSPDPGFDGAMRILGPLIDDAQAAIGYAAVTARPVVFGTIDGADLPAYELTWTDRIT